MARYEHLPLYKKAMELSIYLHETAKNFGRYDKYTTGTDLRNLSREILKLIVRANSTQNKVPILKELVEQCELLKMMVFFAKETKAFKSFETFQKASGLIVNICKQSEGWLSSSINSQNRNPQVMKDASEDHERA